MLLSIPTMFTGEDARVVLGGAAWLLAGLYLTRQPRDRRDRGRRPLGLALAMAGAGHPIADAPVREHPARRSVATKSWPAPTGRPSSTRPPTGGTTTMPERPDAYDESPAEPDYDPAEDTVIGDVVHTAENPVVEASDPICHVTVNFSLAREPHGSHAIRVELPANGRVTAAQAAQIQRDLLPALAAVADLRQGLGFES